jgi:hypothetical protein
MKIKICALFLGILGGLLASPTQEDAQGVFTQKLNKGHYGTATLNRYPPGFVRYWINNITWGKSYTQNLMGEDWTVFVATAIVSGGPDHRHFERYSLKAGIALIQRGEEIFVREPFDHDISAAPPPTPEELKKEEDAAKAELAVAENAERKEADVAKRKKITTEVTAAIAASIEKRKTPLSDGLALTASVDEWLAPDVNIVKKPVELTRYSFKGALGAENLPEWIVALQKWKDWSSKAHSNSVTNVKKEVARFGSFPTVSLQLDVDDKGIVSLLLSGQLSADLLLSEDDAAKFTGSLEKLLADLKAARLAITAAVDKKLAETSKADDLFK